MSVQYRRCARASQTMPSPSWQRLSTTSVAVAVAGSTLIASPLGHAAVAVAPQRIAPLRRLATDARQQLLVDLHAQAGPGQRGDAAVRVAAEIVLVEHVVEQIRPLVVVDADALLLQHRIPADEVH